MIDFSKYHALRELFPELTPGQFEISMLYAMGISQKEISVMRSVSYSYVRKTLEISKMRFEPSSLTGLLSVFHTRLILFALYKCTPPYHK